MASRETAATIGGRYVLLARIGRGGMGTVWRGRDELLQRPVAVKEVRLPDSFPGAEREAARLRAIREARAAAGLTHPGVVTVYDAIEHEDGVYIVMELVEAVTLDELVQAKGPMSPADAAEIGLQVLDVLETAHLAGIVHRDVKPGNVMVTEERGARLTDFGIAAVNDDSKITVTGFVIGSPKFMAPEQASGAPVTSATDLWGLGATLWFAVEGTAPFDRNGAIPTLRAILEDQPPPHRRAGPLGAVLDALLQKDPEARPDASSLREMLRAAAEASRDTSGEASTVTPTQASSTPSREPATPPREPPAAPRPEPGRRGRRAATLVAAALVALSAGVVAALLRGGGSGTELREPSRRAEGVAKEPESAVPEDWTTFEVYDTGASIAYPGGWDVDEGSCDSECIDFRDPESGTYLRLDWQSPPGDDAVAAWKSLASSFAATHDDYREIAIEPIEFKGSDNAALWEYAYSEGGAALHAYNLGVAFEDYGFALNFQTREENWEAHQELWETFQVTFRPPG